MRHCAKLLKPAPTPGCSKCSDKHRIPTWLWRLRDRSSRHPACQLPLWAKTSVRFRGLCFVCVFSWAGNTLRLCFTLVLHTGAFVCGRTHEGARARTYADLVHGRHELHRWKQRASRPRFCYWESGGIFQNSALISGSVHLGCQGVTEATGVAAI